MPPWFACRHAETLALHVKRWLTTAAALQFLTRANPELAELFKLIGEGLTTFYSLAAVGYGDMFAFV